VASWCDQMGIYFICSAGSRQLMPERDIRRSPEKGVIVSDVVFILITLGSFALLALAAKGAEKL
jgi:hypothetical protein